MNKNSISTIKAFFIENTRTRNRRQNLYDVALFIEKQRKEFGSLERVSNEVAGISVNMLNRFLSVLKIDPKLLPYIKNRQIDNINSIYYIHKLKHDDQLYIGMQLVNGTINSSDIRSLIPLTSRFPKKDIKSLLAEILESKNRKRFLIKFDVTKNTRIDLIKSSLGKIIEEKDFEITIEKNVGTIILTQNGQNTLVKHLKNQLISYSDFFKTLLKQ